MRANYISTLSGIRQYKLRHAKCRNYKNAWYYYATSKPKKLRILDCLDMTRKLYTYIVRKDTGLAPNPFWDVCTLAVCTPNHQGSRVRCGDWIAGFLTKACDYRFLYAMEVEEMLGLDEYYRDSRFESKKPNLRGSWKERCGDNFYSRGNDGTWVQHRNRFHLSEDQKRKDTKYARAFVGHRFWYLGKSAAKMPAHFASLAGGRGTRVNHNPVLVEEFCSWVPEHFEIGVHDSPKDNPDIGS